MKFGAGFLVTTLLSTAFLAPARAQPWAGILASDRAMDWSGAGANGLVSRNTVCATLMPSATISEINAAIGSCPSGQVVSLAAGTYNLGSGMIQMKTNVTLRGAGATQTKLVFTGRGTCGGPTGVVCMIGTYISGGYGSTAQHTADWTGAYSNGTKTITLSSTSSLQVGDIVKLDQLDDASDSAGVYVCATGGVCSYTNGGGEVRAGRLQGQLAVVSAVSTGAVTIRSGVHMPNWRSSQAPQATWSGSRPAYGMGVEDLSIDMTGIGNPDGTKSGIVMLAVRDSWVKGIRVVGSDRNYVNVYQSVGITVRDSYFYGCGFCEKTNYGIELYGQSSDVLIENNIFQHQTAPVNINDGGSGNVVGYNFAIDDYRASPPELMQASYFIHSPGTGMLLFEGNSGLGFTNDDWYGTAHFTTLFRNHLYGDICGSYLPGCPTKTSGTAPLRLSAYSRFFNVVGNVLGRSGYYDTYEPSGSTGCGSTYIYCLGDSYATGGVTDAQTKARLMRWGNYDTVTATVRWQPSEVPSSLSQYANPVPSSQALPASFYLAAKPAWFGSLPWPAVGPDVGGGDITGYGGHANKIPARSCWESSQNDSAYGTMNVRLFNPSACYSGGQVAATPNPPSDLLVN